MQRIPAGPALALAILLSACGGGGGSSGSGNTPLPDPTPPGGPLKKYEGVWLDACDSHSRDSTTIAAANGGNTLLMSVKTEFYANAGCTGAVVATGTYPGPAVTFNYSSAVQNASIKLPSGETVTAAVDVGDASASGQAIAFTGSGVSSRIVNGRTVWHIEFSQGSTDVQFDLATGTSKGGLLLRNGELWTVTPSGTGGTAFNVENRLTH
ncbi:hypothetical protein LJR289_005266 [Pseudoduganella sp. LjRoot289]|uniref:hypothetical protein n=1 Tax=Pseudoduganella sp. LjRoot289 TaxID=3342314 RepID=UPI003ECF8EBA